MTGGQATIGGHDSVEAGERGCEVVAKQKETSTLCGKGQGEESSERVLCRRKGSCEESCAGNMEVFAQVDHVQHHVSENSGPILKTLLHQYC